jgi:DNA-binding transcriptional regulator GbsR (MarR family)
MMQEPATVKSHVSRHGPQGGASPVAEQIRLRLAEAWGEMGAAWGVAPAIARVHAYLMARQEPLTEREVREALGLSHRAASLALAEAETWGIVERVDSTRRIGRRGPAGTAYRAVGDHWRWFGRVIAERKVREGDPIISTIEDTAREAAEAAAARPGDADLERLRDWLAAFLTFVRARTRPRAPRPHPGRDDPAPVPAPRRARRRGRPRARRCREPPVA